MSDSELQSQSQSQLLHLLTGAYAVNALDPAEREEFEAHLARCPDCQAEVRGLLETAARLGAAEATAAVLPPARLKAAVMAQIATTPQLPPVEKAHDRVVVPMRRPGWSWAQRSLGLAAAVLAVIAVALSALLVQSNHARSTVDARQAVVTRILTAPDATVQSATIGSAGRVTVVVSPSRGQSVMLGDGMAPAPAGHTYELWYMSDNGAKPAGTFEPDASGHATEVLAGTVGGSTAIGLTVEPAGGSKQPTTKPLFAIPVHSV